MLIPFWFQYETFLSFQASYSHKIHVNAFSFAHSQTTNHIQIYEEILSHQESAHGIYALACAATRRNIACIHIANCQYDKALECMRVVQSIQERHLGPESRRLHNTTSLIRALVKKKTTFLSPSELVRREVARMGAVEFLCAVPPDLTTVAKGSLEELAELRRPPMQCKMSGHKIVYA